MYFIVRHGVRKHKERVKARQGERLQETEGATAQTGEPGDAELAERGTDANRKKRDGPILEPGNTDSSAQPATDVAVNIPAAEPGDVETEKKKKQKEDLSPEEIAAKKRRRVYRWKISFGLFFPFALQALDTTIIASALPYIATDFHQVKQLNWIVSTFNLTSCAFLPFWAQLTDIFGRHNAVQAAVVLVLIGSAICTGSPTSSFGVLLLGRSLQGVGAAGVNISIRTILADRVSLRDYALNWTIFALVSGISFSIGPIIGGFLTRASWRWCFGINLPIAPAAIIVVFLLLRKDLLGPQPLRELEGHDISTRRGRLLARLSTIDYGGQMLFLWGLGLLCLAFTWAGGTFPWHSAAVLAPLIIGSIMSIGWVLYEFSMSPGRVMARILPYQRAMIPWELLSHRDIGLLFYINCTVGMSMFAVMYFMDLYFALVEKKSSSNAGIGLLYFLPGLGIGGYTAIFSSNVWPRQTFPILQLGSITAAVGITVLAVAVHSQNTTLVYVMMALVGHGVGVRMNPGSLHGLAYFPTMTAAVSCLASFAQPFGGLVGLTIMSTVFNNKSGVNQQDPRDGIKWAFIAMIPFMWLGVILTTFLGNVWLGKDGVHEIVNAPFLWSFITGKKLTREKITRGDDLGNLELTNVEKKDKHDIEEGLKQPVEVTGHSQEEKPGESTAV